ncbi:MAG: hypothetical protein NT169_10640 [Chloroflexi bacterium]|nr:hypothetical protein [Chloroflexota bacterium]
MGVNWILPALVGRAMRRVPAHAIPIAAHLRHVSGSRQMSRAMIVTMIGALHWITVATDMPTFSTERIHSTWNVPTANAPIPASQGRSRGLTRRRPGRTSRMARNRQADVVSTRQKASPSALMPLPRTISVMNRPAVDQHSVARMTNPSPSQRRCLSAISHPWT